MKRSPLLVTLGVALTLIAASCSLISTEQPPTPFITPTPHATIAVAATPAPAPSRLPEPPTAPSATPTPPAVSATPVLPSETAAFASPDQPAYSPESGLAPDARRVLDLASLQLSLEQYHVAKGSYPAALVDLFPTYAPRANGQALEGPPLDPATKSPYAYQLSPGGEGYRLTATLDSGKTYSVGRPGSGQADLAPTATVSGR